MHNFRELEVWKKAIDLTTQFYKFSKLYPKDELFGLRFQMATGQCENPLKIREVKKSIARIKTIQREREVNA